MYKIDGRGGSKQRSLEINHNPQPKIEFLEVTKRSLGTILDVTLGVCSRERHLFCPRERSNDPLPPPSILYKTWPEFQLFSTKKYLLCIISGLDQVKTISGPSTAAKTDLQFQQN